MTMHRTLLVLALAATAACFSADPSVGTCKVNDDCSPGSTCNLDLHVCVSACPNACLASQICLGGQCAANKCVPDCATSQACDLGQNPPVCVDLIGTVTVTDNPAANSNGFYPRSASVSIPVTVVLNAGSGTVSSASLSAGSVTGVVGTNTSGNTWAFTVPTTAQTPGSETPLLFTISATTAAGTVLTATEPSTAAQLKIDDKGPTVSAIAVQGGVTGLNDSNKWFKVDGTAKASIQATIVDSGSGFDASTIQLQNTSGTRIDDGAPTAGAAGVFTFHVPQNLVSAGAESLVNFQIIATDHLSHAQSGTNTGAFGLDGKPPVLTFATIPYPAARTGCSADTASVFCGHDGAHFLRNGSGTLSFTAMDGGAGVDSASGICTVTGATTCTAIFAGGKFSFPIDFSTLNVTTGPDGTFAVSVTMNGKDLVGNAATQASGSANMTRVKWVRTTGITLAGAPVLSSSLNALIVAGNNNSADPIAAIDTTIANGGGSLWTAGHGLSPVITNVPGNMILDATASTDANRPTPVLYLNALNTSYALHVTSTGIDKYCVVNAPGVAGSPVLFGSGATSEAIVATGTLLKTVVPDAMASGGGACDTTSVSLSNGAKLGPPAANGTTIFLGYDNTVNVANDFGLASLTFNGTAFSSAQTSNLNLEPTTNARVVAVTPAANIFFGDDQFTRKFYSASTALVVVNSSTAFTGAQRIVAQPVVSGGLVFGATNQLNVYTASTMAPAWTALNSVGAVTPPAIGTSAVYLSESANNQLHSIDATLHVDQWVYGGSGTSSPVTTIVSPTTEPTLAADGTLYFGDNGGRVYAVITDTAPAATAAGDWPHTGFDNCNSNHANNTGFTCQ